MRFAFLAVAALLALGCATVPVSPTLAKPVPSERVKWVSKSTTGGKVTITRDDGLVSKACYLALWVDGELAARLGAGESITLHVAPGEHTLKAGRDPEGSGLCGIKIEGVWVQLETVIQDGQSKFFRLGQNGYGEIQFQRGEP